MVGFSRDGRALVTGRRVVDWPDGEPTEAAIKRWDVASLQQTASFGAPTAYVSRLAFSPNGATLATSGGREDVITLWDVASG
ncbi:MAG: hypothetical protein ABGY41_17720, partial [Candidatus Poribacteria bacterium]